ncbi:ATP-binding protein [Leptothoe spongobia]|uniref:ATP-binding protein n=1 Tax=Leptothoe spongobia TaxID=2651728 RepID=UPI003899327D
MDTILNELSPQVREQDTVAPDDPLTLSLWGLKALLEHHTDNAPHVALEAVLESEPLPLARLGDAFNLSLFERTILLLCLGLELEPNFQSLCAKVHGNDNKPYATLGLALSTFPEADWSVLSPQTPLHYWQLIHPEPSRVLTEAPLKLDRRILCYLLDEPALPPHLIDLGTPLSPEGLADTLPPSYADLIQQLITTWSTADATHGFTLICLNGPDTTTNTNVAIAACHAMGMPLMALSAAVLHTNPQDLTQLQREWEREALLTRSALLLDCDTAQPGDPGRDTAISLFLETLSTPVIVCSRDKKPQVRRPLITFEVPPLNYTEQKDLWLANLGPLAADLDGHVDLLATQFRLSPTAVQSVCRQAKGIINEEQGTRNKLDVTAGSDEQNSKSKIQNSLQEAAQASTKLKTHLWDLCRAQARPNLDDLAQRIESMATWEDLVLPDRQRLILEDIATHLTYRSRVYQEWGFAKKGDRGLGTSALFYGESGTGKTMAAEVLANSCQLDLYRIDLSTVVSKYIGETEKNLRRIFDAAETGGVILLFDEADALFGKRSEVKDSHDRHANIEVSYLLQRMEAYRGLAILTSNMKDSLDKAFLRRIRFMMVFPFPDASARAEIWQRIFPAQTPTQGLDYTKLGQLKVAGGNIRNIALQAAFIAAQADQSVSMAHIRQAAQREYLKLEKLLTTEEIKGWDADD